MGIAGSTILIAVGAILAWGIEAAVPHANLRVIGIILMIVGAVGLLASLAIEAPRRRVRQSRYVSSGPPVSPSAQSSGYEERIYEDRNAF